MTEYRVEPASHEHLPGMVHLLGVSFPESLLTALGPAFLRELLASYLTIPGGCGYVCLARGSEEVVGLVVGSEDSRRHRRLLLMRWPSLLLQAARGLVVSPRAVALSLRYAMSQVPPRPSGARQSDVVSGDGSIPAASLTFLAVSHQHRRRGIADRLSGEFLREMARRGVDRLKLAVATDNQGALSFYLSRGWRIAARVPTSYGRGVYRLICQSAPVWRERRSVV